MTDDDAEHRRPRVWTLNSFGALVDRAIPSLRAPIPGSLFLNFHLVADKR